MRGTGLPLPPLPLNFALTRLQSKRCGRVGLHAGCWLKCAVADHPLPSRVEGGQRIRLNGEGGAGSLLLFLLLGSEAGLLGQPAPRLQQSEHKGKVKACKVSVATVFRKTAARCTALTFDSAALCISSRQSRAMLRQSYHECSVVSEW